MRIDLTTCRLDAVPNPENGKAGSKAPASCGALGADRASLQFDRTRVQALVAKVAEVSDSRADRVAGLGQAIREGHYAIDAEGIAGAMLQAARG